MIQAHSSVFCFTVGCEFVSPFTPQIKTAGSYRLLSLCAAVRVWGSHMNSLNTPSLSVTLITYQLDTQGASEPHFKPAAELTPSLLSTISTILADMVHSIKRTLTYTVGARGWDILSHLFGTNLGDPAGHQAPAVYWGCSRNLSRDPPAGKHGSRLQPSLGIPPKAFFFSKNTNIRKPYS